MWCNAPPAADTQLHYTPLLRHPEHPHYYIVELRRLAMGGQDLPVAEVLEPIPLVKSPLRMWRTPDRRCRS
jgi:hypothetical protein